jgi:hypothetical protein
MFQLYDQTRRRICIALFFILCVAPTALVIAWCIERHLPGYVRQETDRLQRQLGVRAELERFWQPKPGRTVYEGLRIRDAETGRDILQCRRLEATENGDNRPLTLSVAGLEVRPEQWEQAWQVLDRVLGCRAGWSSLDVELQADQAVLRAADEPRSLDRVMARLRILPEVSELKLEFRVPGVEMPEPAWFRIVRNRQTAPPETGFEWNTGAAAIPCSLLPVALKFTEMLGPQSWLRGSGWANRTAEGWVGVASGQLLQVDLDKLVTGRFPHVLSGTAQIRIADLQFHRGCIQKFHGLVEAGPGMMSRSLVDAAIDRLGLNGPSQPALPQSLVPYDQFAVEFLLDVQGLQLLGRCTQERNAILTTPYGPVVAASTRAVPISTLLHILAPGTHSQVPAVSQVEPLLRHLPFPAATPPQPATAVASPDYGDQQGSAIR